jgi:hypothetical protein
VAVFSCEQANTGGRDGRRLPTGAELASLRDESVVTDPQLPTGSPFDMTLTGAGWWTSTGDLDIPSDAHRSTFVPGSGPVISSKLSAFNFWCVRGPTSNQ